MRLIYLIAGCLVLVLAIVGAVLPVMPTTVFVILAAWCLGKSHPRLEAWLLSHPVFGPPLRDWRQRGAISPLSKALAVAGMTVGYVVFYLLTQPSIALALAAALPMAAGAAYVLTRPH